MNSLRLRRLQLCPEEIAKMMACSSGTCISLFIVPGPEAKMRQDFEYLITQIEADLDKFYQLDASETEALLQPIADVLDNPELGFLKQGGGLFVSDQEAYYYPGLQLHSSRAMVDDYFYVLPLFVTYSQQPCFPLLVIDKEKLVLYRISQGQKQAVALPEQIDASWYHQLEQEFQLQQQLLIFCQEQALCEQWSASLTARYPTLEIRHVHRKYPQQNLVEAALEKMASGSKQLAAISQYHDLSFTERILDDTSQLAQAAYNSRIETLFLVDEGRKDSSRGLLELINRAAIYTYINEGNIYLARSGELNGVSLAAAILRY